MEGRRSLTHQGEKSKHTCSHGRVVGTEKASLHSRALYGCTRRWTFVPAEYDTVALEAISTMGCRFTEGQYEYPPPNPKLLSAATPPGHGVCSDTTYSGDIAERQHQARLHSIKRMQTDTRTAACLSTGCCMMARRWQS